MLFLSNKSLKLSLSKIKTLFCSTMQKLSPFGFLKDRAKFLYLVQEKAKNFR